MTRIALTSFLALGLAAGAAEAQAPFGAPGGGIVGGGSATMTGGGDERTITYAMGGAGGGAPFEQEGRSVTFAGSHGDGPLWHYRVPATTNGAGREAWLVGGGDNAEVVYIRPR